MIDRKALNSAPSRPRQWRLLLWAGAVALFLLPLVLVQLIPQMNWGAEDFAAAALLVGGVAAGIELVVRLLRTPVQRLAGAAAVIVAGLVVWAELAVGILD